MREMDVYGNIDKGNLIFENGARNNFAGSLV